MKITMYFSDRNSDRFLVAANVADNKFGKSNTTVRYIDGDQRYEWDAAIQIRKIHRIDSRKKGVFVQKHSVVDSFVPDSYTVEDD